MIRIPFDEAAAVLAAVLGDRGFPPDGAALSARLFCQANRDGVLSHGLDRFGNLIGAVDSGRVDPAASPERTWSGGALERWNGRRGPGNLNAHACMSRALELAEEFGVGCVALAETNHWMRAGNYGWQAVDAGFIGLCWTNTMPNLPPWGSSRPLVGNNPLVVAVPREAGPVVLDMALSQFSYGALSRHAAAGTRLPVTGGYDGEGRLTDDPAAVAESMRPLPVGFWKGSGLAVALDLVAALLSGGRATCDIPSDPGSETGVSQVFLAFAPPAHPGLADRVVDSLAAGAPGEEVFYPGERTLRKRRESDRDGIPVDESVWRNILEMRRR